MKIKLTGSNGYIGQLISTDLQKKGHAVYGINRDLLYDPSSSLQEVLRITDDVISAGTSGRESIEWIQQAGANACGVAIAAPDRKVVLLEGDFSLMQGNTALWSMAQHNLDICVVNFNNQGSASLTTELARVRRGEQQPKSMEMLNINNPPVDYAAMAESMGVPATRAGTAEEFHEQLAAAMKKKGPHFIDADITKGSIKEKLSAMHRANYEAKYYVK